MVFQLALLIALATVEALTKLLPLLLGAAIVPLLFLFKSVVLALNMKFKPFCLTVMVELLSKLTVLLVLLTSVAVTLLLVIFQVLLTLFNASSTLV